MEKLKIFLSKLFTIHYSLFTILLLGGFLRLWRIAEYLTFLGDEGRDALAVWKIVTLKHLTLIGPSTSVGSMYLGPIYYYLMAPFLWLSRLDPVGPAIMVALLGIATIYLVYLVGKEFFNSWVGLIASLIYAISPVVIFHSRSSWNPNVMPFFTLLFIYSLFKLAREQNYRFLMVASFSLAVALQSHYLGILLLPLCVWEWLVVFKKSKKRQALLRYSVYSTLIFCFLFIFPLVWFDLRHHFLNSKALMAFIKNRESTGVDLGIIKRVIDNLVFLFERLVLAKEKIWAWPFLVLIASGLALWFKKEKDEIKRKNLKLLFLWIAVGSLGLAVYKGRLYDHYFGFLFPLPFLLTALVIDFFLKRGREKYLGLLLIIGLLFLNLAGCPLRYPPNKQLEKTKIISKKILDEAKGEPLNMALIAKQNYHAAYQYFVELWGGRVYKTDNRITEQLYVVCEDKPCQPVGHPLWEIASFGWAKIENQWPFPWGLKLFKLVPNPSGGPQ
jgi:4-amino-4-deoxy-L-arabinose transferase-like glycosyltransferase